ncbi:MAG: hypothetical protein ACNI27_00330 [Desulfovibrio sp.]
MSKQSKTLESVLLANGLLSVKQIQEAHKMMQKQPDLNFDNVVVAVFGIKQQTLDQLRIDNIVMPRFRAEVIQLFLASHAKDKFAPEGKIINFVEDVTIIPRESEVRNTSKRIYKAATVQKPQVGTVLKGDLEPERSAYTETTVEAKVTFKTKSGDLFSCPLIARNDSRTLMLTLDDFLGLFHTTIYSPIRHLFKQYVNEKEA